MKKSSLACILLALVFSLPTAYADSALSARQVCMDQSRLIGSEAARYVLCTSISLGSSWSVIRNGGNGAPIALCEDQQDSCLKAFAQAPTACTSAKVRELQSAVRSCRAPNRRALFKKCIDNSAALMNRLFRQNISCESAPRVVSQPTKPTVPFEMVSACRALSVACPALYRKAVYSE